jgi:hypothetical protein
MRLPRAFAATTALWLSGIVAHGIAQGTFVELRQAFILSALIFLPTLMFMPKITAGPVLASVVTLAQLVGHFVLGGSSNSSNEMFATHVIVGLATYFLIKNLDELLTSINDFVAFIFQPYISILEPQLIPITKQQVSGPSQLWESHLDTRSCGRRGPPLNF